jgi:hypothetical protein
MEYLAQRLHVVTMARLALQGKKPAGESVAITIDDGYSTFEIAYRSCTQFGSRDGIPLYGLRRRVDAMRGRR